MNTCLRGYVNFLLKTRHNESHFAMFDGHWSGASRDNYLTCHVSLQNHVIEGSRNFMSGSSSPLLVVEICF